MTSRVSPLRTWPRSLASSADEVALSTRPAGATTTTPDPRSSAIRIASGLDLLPADEPIAAVLPLVLDRVHETPHEVDAEAAHRARLERRRRVRQRGHKRVEGG